MNLASILVVGSIALAGGVMLWRRSQRGETPRQMKTIGVGLIAIGALGVAAVVIDLAMFALFP